jgi:hypothetical protein
MKEKPQMSFVGTLPAAALPELRELYTLWQKHEQAYKHRFAVNLACQGHDPATVRVLRIDLDTGEYTLDAPTLAPPPDA